MQRNKKALLIYFSIVSLFCLALLVFTWVNVGKFDIKFFYKIYTGKSDKVIRIQETQSLSI